MTHRAPDADAREREQRTGERSSDSDAAQSESPLAPPRGVVAIAAIESNEAQQFQCAVLRLGIHLPVITRQAAPYLLELLRYFYAIATPLAHGDVLPVRRDDLTHDTARGHVANALQVLATLEPAGAPGGPLQIPVVDLVAVRHRLETALELLRPIELAPPLPADKHHVQ